MFPISHIVVEDIKAWTKKGQKKWNKSFSPLECGKQWFYSECEKLGKLTIFQGYETKEMRDILGLKKLFIKLSSSFYAHCVDSWVLAYKVIGGEVKPENTIVLTIVPLRFHRRQLHVFNFAKGGIRKLYGGTRSLGFKRGSLVKHPKFGLSYVGGTSKDRISLHRLEDGKRLTQTAKPEDIRFLTYASWRFN